MDTSAIQTKSISPVREWLECEDRLEHVWKISRAHLKTPYTHPRCPECNRKATRISKISDCY